MKYKWKLAFLVFIGTVALLLGAMQAAAAGDSEEQEEHPAKVRSRLKKVNQQTVISLTAEEQQKSGIVVQPLTIGSNQLQIQLYGLVLGPSNLAQLRQTYVAARAQAQQAQAQLSVAQQEYERTKILFEKNEIASQKAYQTAVGNLHVNQAAVATADQAQQTVRETARQSWGPVIATWMLDDAPEFQRLIRQQDLLLYLTAPSGTARFSAPTNASVQASDGKLLPARLIAPAPLTDPRLQGQSYYYLTANPGAILLPGMNVTAFIPTGPSAQGVTIPFSAVVWLGGLAWAYFRQDAEYFIRRRISTDQPQPDGWFQPKADFQHEPVVVKGAQLLLSEEFRSRLSTAGGGDTD